MHERLWTGQIQQQTKQVLNTNSYRKVDFFHCCKFAGISLVSMLMKMVKWGKQIFLCFFED